MVLHRLTFNAETQGPQRAKSTIASQVECSVSFNVVFDDFDFVVRDLVVVK